MNDINFCEYISNIYKDPKAKAPQLTIGQFMQLQQHVSECEPCCAKVDEVLELAKETTNSFTDIASQN